MDFGLAREAGEGRGLTESGAVIGTPAYLHEYKQAHEHLSRAATRATPLPELHYALGCVQGALCSKALEDARRSGDASFFEKLIVSGMRAIATHPEDA